MPATDAQLLAAIDRGIATGDLVVLTPDVLAELAPAGPYGTCAPDCGVCATLPTHRQLAPRPSPSRGRAPSRQENDMSTETVNLATGPITYEQIGELSLALLDIVPDNATRTAVINAVIEKLHLRKPNA